MVDVPGDTGAIAAMRFAVVDVETSGLSIRWHHVLQVGVVVVDGDGVVLERWGSVLAPRRRWWYRVGPTKIHGITRSILRTGAPGDEVLHRLAASLTGSMLVAHNAAFDTAFLHKAAARYGVDLPLGTALCTLRLSRRLDPDRHLSHRLGDLCQRYGVQLIRPHDALADADATAAILPHLLRAHDVQRADQLTSLL